MRILKEVRNSPFIKYTKRLYIGKIRYGIPCFYPRYYCPTFIKMGKIENKPKFISYKNWNLNKSYWFGIGIPVIFRWITLGWKDKFGTPRCEWQPFFTIYFFKFQLCLFFISPDKTEAFEKYWEMFLWWRYYSNKDIKKAEETWSWIDKNWKSTWNKTYIK